jgi:hypothetical protein
MQKDLFDKRNINPKFKEQIVDFNTDRFYQDLTEEDKSLLLEQIEYCGKTISGKRVWNVGHIKHCPTCQKIRITDCCACGCGSCYTCGNRWSCTPPINSGSIFLSKEETDRIVTQFSVKEK